MHCELHRDSRIVNHDMRQRCGSFHVGDGFPNANSLHACDGNDVTQLSPVYVNAFQSAEGKQFGNFYFLQGAIELGYGNVFSVTKRPVKYTSDDKPSAILPIIKLATTNLHRIPLST